MDNGKGIAPDELVRLRASLQKPMLDSKDAPSIGIMNVHARLRLIFGEQFGLEIDSRISEGTEITLYIPKIEVNL